MKERKDDWFALPRECEGERVFTSFVLAYNAREFDFLFNNNTQIPIYFKYSINISHFFIFLF